MVNVRYKKICIIGYGKIAKDILSFVCRNKDKNAYQVIFIEHEKDRYSYIKEEAQKLGADFISIENTDVLSEWFLQIKEPMLIISVINNYLFRRELIEKSNICIINYHFSLLPKYAGRNGLVWSIYNDEKEVGITWHYIGGIVDGGDIITQRRMYLGRDDRAFEVANRMMDLAYDAFCDCFDSVLHGTDHPYPQVDKLKYKEYKSTDIPRNGYFNLADNVDEIYRLLRATDFGGIRERFDITSTWNGHRIKIKRYKKINVSKREDQANVIYLPISKEELLKLKYVEVY